MSEWQPIETAPTDREIIVANYESARTAQHMTAIEDGSIAWVIARGRDVAFLSDNPTHWMEKPALPSLNSGAAK